MEGVGGWGMRVPLGPAGVVGVEGPGAVETRPDGAAGRSAGLEGARTHAPWVVGSRGGLLRPSTSSRPRHTRPEDGKNGLLLSGEGVLGGRPGALRGVRHAGQLLLGAALEVVPALLYLLASALPTGDAVDLGGDAVPHTPPLRHAHPTALRAVELRVVGAHLPNQDLVFFEREARLAQPGGLFRFARRRRGHGAPRRRRPVAWRMGGAGAVGTGRTALAGARRPRAARPTPAAATPALKSRGPGMGAEGGRGRQAAWGSPSA
uniref:Uncharacterized protein n=1 Tax=Rhinolophus ferrumequinum TaxID=59479 RepID=A0A671EPK4_RHIFE